MCIIELIQWSYLVACLLKLYETDLGPISLTWLLTPFAIHVPCNMIAHGTKLLIIHVVCNSNRTPVIVLIVRYHRRFDDIRCVYFLFISFDIKCLLSDTCLIAVRICMLWYVCTFMAIKLFELKNWIEILAKPSLRTLHMTRRLGYHGILNNSNSWLRDFEILRDDAPRMRSQYVPAIGVSLTY